MVSSLAAPEGKTKGRYDAKSFSRSPPFLHELRPFAQYALGEGIPLFQLTTVKAVAVIIRRMVSNGKAGALPIIEVNIAAQDIFHSVPRAALLQSEVDEEFFFIQPFRASLAGLSVGLPARDIERTILLS